MFPNTCGSGRCAGYCWEHRNEERLASVSVGLCLGFTAHRDCDWNPREKVKGARRRNLEERGCLRGTGKGVHVYVMLMFIFPVSTVFVNTCEPQPPLAGSLHSPAKLVLGAVQAQPKICSSGVCLALPSPQGSRWQLGQRD